jgi:peroxiredoxin family protein
MADLALNEETIRRIVREEIEAAFKKDPAANGAAIIASKGTLEGAYPPLVLATTAVAMGMDTSIFFTSHGLNIIHKDFEARLEATTTESTFTKKNVAPIRELLDVARESGVRLIACQTTMDVFGFTRDDFIAGIEFGGAAAFLSLARRSHVTLFI